MELASGEAGGAPERVPVLPKQVYSDAVTDRVENVAFLRCPPGARVRVDVPLALQGADACPGLRKGGTLNTMRRKVALWCDAGAVPPSLPLDVSELEIGGKVELGQLALPPGCAHVENNLKLAAVKIAGRTASRTAAAAEGGEGAAASPAASKPAAK